MRAFANHLCRRLALATLFGLVPACGPSLEKASKEATSFNERTRVEAIARVEADRSLTLFLPPARDATATIVTVADPWLQGCLFEADGQLGLREDVCRLKNGRQYDLRYYRSGIKVIIVRLDTETEEERSYDVSTCLREGLHGGADTSRYRAASAADAPSPGPAAPPTVQLKMLGVSSSADVVVREARYRVKVVTTTCTGTYETLGYPP
jgi:hypothetical protein